MGKYLKLMKHEKKRAFAFTGAGISTTLGIPDYRSKEDTILESGTGTWNKSKEQRSEDWKQI